MMLNILLKTGQKCLCRIPTREQRHRNHIHLLSTARAVGGHAAHGQRMQHYGNAEVKLPLTASFQLVDGALNAFRQVALLKHNHDLPQAKGAGFQILSYPCAYFAHGQSVYRGFTAQKA